MNVAAAGNASNDLPERVRLLENVVRSLLRDVVPHTRDTGHNAADREMQEAIQNARAAVPESGQETPIAWPTEPGWYWAFGRVAGMQDAKLMSARALMEGEQLIVYVGEAMVYRLSRADTELPLQFRPAVLPRF